jgi:hypothetical protein
VSWVEIIAKSKILGIKTCRVVAHLLDYLPEHILRLFVRHGCNFLPSQIHLHHQPLFIDTLPCRSSNILRMVSIVSYHLAPHIIGIVQKAVESIAAGERTVLVCLGDLLTRNFPAFVLTLRSVV